MTFTESDTVEAFVHNVLCASPPHPPHNGRCRPCPPARRAFRSRLALPRAAAASTTGHEVLVEDHLWEARIHRNPGDRGTAGSGRRRAAPASGHPDGRADGRAGQGELRRHGRHVVLGVDLGPRGPAHLAGARRGEHEKLDRQLHDGSSARRSHRLDHSRHVLEQASVSCRGGTTAFTS